MYAIVDASGDHAGAVCESAPRRQLPGGPAGLPSATARRQMWLPPPRSDTNAICRPSGDHADDVDGGIVREADRRATAAAGTNPDVTFAAQHPVVRDPSAVGRVARVGR